MGERTVLVTGASGFVGISLLPSLAARGWKVRAAVRAADRLMIAPAGVEKVVTGNLGPDTDWRSQVAGQDTVVHLAARVHRLHESAGGAEEAYRADNVETTRALARAAASAGCKRLIFLSSVKAMGEATAEGEVWDETSPCRPQGAYGRSKAEAEAALIEESRTTGLTSVILRAPLVYGPGQKANMARLFRLVGRGWPLPLANVTNARSILYVGNLVDAIATALERPEASGTYLLSDGPGISTPALIGKIAVALGRSPRLLPAPRRFLNLAAAALGRKGEIDRLFGSLCISSARFRRDFEWTPPFTTEDGLRRTALALALVEPR